MIKNKPPNKIIPIEFLRIKHNMRKICSCENPQYEVDTANRAVWCQFCGACIDPFEAMLYIAKYPEQLKEQTDELKTKYGDLVEKYNELVTEVNQLANKKARLNVFKGLESSYRNDMLPHCPECNKVFRFEKITGWTNRAHCQKKD